MHKEKDIFDVIVNHLGLDKGEHEVGEADRKGDDTSVGSRLELARLEVEKKKLKAENLRLEHELTLRQIELKQVSARVGQFGQHIDEDREYSVVPDVARMTNSVPQFDECDLDSFSLHLRG